MFVTILFWFLIFCMKQYPRMTDRQINLIIYLVNVVEVSRIFWNFALSKYTNGFSIDALDFISKITGIIGVAH